MELMPCILPHPVSEMTRKNASALAAFLGRNMSGDMNTEYSIMGVLIYSSAGVDIICRIESDMAVK